MRSATRTRKRDAGFSQDERAAMRERARELKAARSRTLGGANGESAVLEKIAGMVPADRALARQVHAHVMRSAPQLEPRLWYGMPAYALAGKVVCFLQPAHKFKTRYATLGFSDQAKLDDGAMWPVAFALDRLTPEAGRRIAALVRKAVGTTRESRSTR
jgi:uncharacterized protein YdhG (YjbR/CyaY superfamily)